MGIKISDLSAIATNASDTDLFEISDDTGASSYVSKKITFQQLYQSIPKSLVVAVSDETTDLTTGTSKLTFRAPSAMELIEVRASVNTAPTTTKIIVDINDSGVSIFSTTLSIDPTEKTSTTAGAPAVISDSSIADDAEITIDIDQIGSGTAGKGLKVTFIYTEA